MTFVFEGVEPREEQEVIEPSPEQKGFVFEGIEKPPVSEKIQRGGREIGRQIARTGARAFESIVGIPKELFQLLERGIRAGAEKITGREVPEFPITEVLFPGLKTAEEIRTLEKPVFREYLEPRTEKEKIVDEFTSLAAPLALPVVGFGSIPRALKAAAGGIALKHTAKAMNAPESVQNLMQFVGTFAGSKIPKFKTYEKALYQSADTLLPAAATTSAKPILKNIETLETFASKGLKTPAKKTILDTTQQLKNVLKEDKVKIKDLIELKKDLNEIINFEIPQGRKSLLKGLNRNVGKLIEDYGKRENPEFLKSYKSANQLHGELAQSYKTDEFFKGIKKLEDLGMAGAILTGHWKAVPAFFLAKGTTSFIQNLLTRPQIRKFYFKAIEEAVKHNKGGVIQAARNMNKAMEPFLKESFQGQEDRFEFID